MTKTEYLAYQETQRQERIASAQAKYQLVNNKKIINNKVTSLRLKGKELTEGEELAALEKEQAFFEKISILSGSLDKERFWVNFMVFSPLCKLTFSILFSP